MSPTGAAASASPDQLRSPSRTQPGADGRGGVALARSRHPGRLPNGRAVAGGFFIVAAALIAFFGWLTATRTHSQQWVVAREPLAAGTELSMGELTTSPMRLPRTTAAEAFSDPTQLVGRVLAAPSGAGELIQRGALLPTSQQPVVRPVSVVELSSDVAPLAQGQSVDVLVTEGSGAKTNTSVVVRGAQVLSLLRPTSSLVGNSASAVVTIGVEDLAEVEAVVQAEHAGTVTLVVAEPSDGRGIGASAGSTGSTGSTGSPKGTGGG
ncbi:MAG: SAF domain-containing protein [Acidimicrobiales bacterium]